MTTTYPRSDITHYTSGISYFNGIPFLAPPPLEQCSDVSFTSEGNDIIAIIHHKDDNRKDIRYNIGRVLSSSKDFFEIYDLITSDSSSVFQTSLSSADAINKDPVLIEFSHRLSEYGIYWVVSDTHTSTHFFTNADFSNKGENIDPSVRPYARSVALQCRDGKIAISVRDADLKILYSTQCPHSIEEVDTFFQALEPYLFPRS